MRETELMIGYVLRAGLWLSVVIVLMGGSLYLLQNGGHLIHYQVFEQGSKANLSALSEIWGDVFSFSARGIIELGLLVLVFTQVLRVVLTAWMFFVVRDYFFTIISLLILGVLIYSIFWRG